MTRLARRESKSGYMHVIVRGIGKQVLFESREDYGLYISLLEKYSRETEVMVCAYCLMENHVHLLLMGSIGQIALLMKKLGVAYAHYFNEKNERTGHLFQDRYLSEPVETESYLMNVFRYILQNPQKAGTCLTDEYEWSSYYEYGVRYSFVDTSVLEGLIGDWDDYEKFMMTDDPRRYMEFEHFRRDDDWALGIIRDSLNMESGTELQRLGREARDECLRRLKSKGLSIRQIERLTGISRGVIYKA